MLRAIGGSAPGTAGKEAGLLPPAREGSTRPGQPQPPDCPDSPAWAENSGQQLDSIFLRVPSNSEYSMTARKTSVALSHLRVWGRMGQAGSSAASSRLQTLQSNVGLLPAAQTAPSLPFDPAAHLKHFCLSCERFVVISGQSPVCH